MKHEELFSGKLGLYPHLQIHIDIDKNALPFHSCPCPVPHVDLGVFKRELDYLCAIGVLSRQGPSEWASPTFITSKKAGRIC